MRLTRLIGAGVIAYAVWAGWPAPALAGPGTLDPSFGSGGSESYDLGLNSGAFPFSRFSAVGVSGDGTIYAAGVSGTGGGEANGFRTLLAKVADTGALDPSFGTGGAVFLTGNGSGALLVEPNDSVIVDGHQLERLTAFGQPDPSFHPSEGGPGVSLRLSDGDLAGVGGASIRALRPDGEPDPGFGAGGVATLTAPAGQELSAASLLQQPDGELFVAGSGSEELGRNEGPRSFYWLAKLSSTGSQQGGISEIQGGGAGPVLEPRPGGFVLVAASASSEGWLQATAWGLTSQGLPDPAFGTGGVEVLPPKPGTAIHSNFAAAAVEADGRVLVAFHQAPVIVRLEPNGEIDRNFGEGGWASGPFGTSIQALTVDSSGRILAAGSFEQKGKEYASITRFLGGEVPKPLAPSPSNTRPLKIAAAKLTHKRFRVGTRPTAISARSVPTGTSLRFRLSSAARLRVAIERVATGLRHGRRCVAPTSMLKRTRAKRCQRTRLLGMLTRAHEPDGADRMAFSGRIGRRALAPGRYEAVLRASNAHGRSHPVVLSFTVVRG